MPTVDDVSRAAADRTIDVLRKGVAERGVAHLALTGGSSAIPLYEELARPARRAQLAWENVHFWWGDERYVPLDHPESNAGLANRLLFAIGPRSGESGDGGEGADVEAGALPGLMVDPEKVHAVQVDATSGHRDGPARAAAEYAAEIKQWLPLDAGGTPIFDVILTGIGPDGHLMSIFPGSPALAPDAPIAMGIPAPQHVEPHLPRVTLAARVLPVARQVVVMAVSAGKVAIVRDVLGGRRDAQRWPVQSALLPNALWLVDRAAAGVA
jgi:6-phosphogluconolactonase